jgi:hypothetical protein
MSKGFIESNEETSRELFYKKAVYMSVLSEYNYINLVDFCFAEKQLYGRVNRHFEPIVLSGMPNTKLKNFTSVSDSKMPPSALPFVVDAFEKLKQQFDKCAQDGLISTSDTYLSSLKVYKAHVSAPKQHKEYIDNIAEEIAGSFKGSNPKIRDFDQFILRLVPMLHNFNKTHPLTFPAFVKSRECPMNISGLVVEVADLTSDNDLEKIKKFVQSPNWEFYLNACNSYGFMVDVRNPWRLVADIAGFATLECAKPYYLDTTDRILDVAYSKAYSNRYFEKFKQMLLRLYNLSKDPKIYENVSCDEGSPRMRMVDPRNYTPAELYKIYDDFYFLKLYFKIRFFEEESKFSADEKTQITNQCLQLANIDFDMALNSFERILNKTLDYSGAINYIVKRQELLAQ